MIQPHLRIEKCNPCCILVGNPSRVLLVCEHLKNSKKISENRGYIVYEGIYEGIKINVICIGIGGPSAAIALEELINAGAKIVIRVGSGASLRKDIIRGDAIISTGIYKEELSSTAYAPLNYPAVPNYDVLNALIESAKELKYKHNYGLTMSCDAMYSLHHRQTMIELSDKGIIGSEMEGSMIFTLSSLKGIKAGMIFHANLNIKNNETSKDILSQNKIREEGEKKTIIIALNAIKKLSMEVKK